MTTDEALDLISNADPARTIFLHEERVHFRTGGRQARFRVSFIPGFNDEHSVITGPSLQHVVDDALTAINLNQAIT